MRELVCIICPSGCRLQAEYSQDKIVVRGARCERGRQYAAEEMTHPVRVVTSTVAVRGGLHRRLPVKTSVAVPKDTAADIVQELRGIRLQAPVEAGQVILRNVAGTDASIVATRDMPTGPHMRPCGRIGAAGTPLEEKG